MSITISNIQATTIKSSSNIVLNTSTLTMGENEFPSTDGKSRSVASFGPSSTAAFISKSRRQLVTTAAAIISPGINIIGVNFNGPVVLTLADGEANMDEIDIVDEGGFCNPTNTISVQTSTGAATGSIIMTTPFGFLKTRTNGTEWFSEVKSDVTILHTDGSSTITSQNGNVVEVAIDGSS